MNNLELTLIRPDGLLRIGVSTELISGVRSSLTAALGTGVKMPMSKADSNIKDLVICRPHHACVNIHGSRACPPCFWRVWLKIQYFSRIKI